MEREAKTSAARRALGRLQRYVLGEFMLALALAAGVFTGLFVLMTALSLEADARSYGTDVVTLAGAVPYFLPYILCFSVPMAFLVAAVLAFGRLESSGEISAMRAAGMRLTTVVAPVLAVALLAAVPLVLLADRGVGWGFTKARELVRTSGRSAVLERAGTGMTHRIDTPERSYRIHRFGPGPDGGRPLAIVEFAGGSPREVVLARDHELDAETGAGPGGELDLLRFRIGGASAGGFAWARILKPGDVVLAGAGELSIATKSSAERRGKFGRKPYAQPLSANVREARRLRERTRRLEREELEAATRAAAVAISGGHCAPELESRLARSVVAYGAKRDRIEIATSELRAVEMEIHRKLSFAFAPLALALLGIPLGLRFARGGRLGGFAVGIAVIGFFYYPLWFSGQGLATAGVLPAGVSVWMAQIITGGAGAWWLSRMA